MIFYDFVSSTIPMNLRQGIGSVVYKYSKGHENWRAEKLQRSRTKNNRKRSDKTYNPNKIILRNKVLNLILLDAPTGINGLFSTESHHEFCDWLDRFYHEALESNVIIRFSEDVRLMAHTAILLFAKIDLILNRVPKRKISFNLRKATKHTRDLIFRSGLAERIDHPSSRTGTDPEFPILYSDCSLEQFGRWEEAVDIIVEALGLKNTESEHRIGSSLSEAVMNVNRHAYPETDLRDEKKWWLYFEIQDDQLYLAIFDAGVGIPETLPHKQWVRDLAGKKPSILKAIARAITDSDDAAVIRASMIKGRTSTQQKKHGLGSVSILDLVESNSTGTLWICSNCGIYQKKSNKAKPELMNSKGSIHGTLVQWNIRLSDADHD